MICSGPFLNGQLCSLIEYVNVALVLIGPQGVSCFTILSVLNKDLTQVHTEKNNSQWHIDLCTGRSSVITTSNVLLH